MGDQEPQSSDVYFQETEERGGAGFDYAAVNRFLMVMRNGSNYSTASPVSDSSDLRMSTSKRRSPTSPFLEEPKPKKAALRNSPASTHHGDLRGFTRVPLPNASPVFWEPTTSAPSAVYLPSPAIRRTVSDMDGALGHYSLSVPSGFLNKPKPSVPSPVKTGSSASADTPIGMPPLHRSNSAPVQVPVPDPYLLSTSSPESVNIESPSSHRLRRMKDKMKEMSQWWNQIICEGEDDDDRSPVNNNNCGHQKVEHEEEEVGIEEEEEGEAVQETEEGVSVEKTKKGLKVQIKCPCGKGYHVFFSGKNCYYQLI